MPLNSDAAMLLFCDYAGDVAEHDDWHTYEHLHERLSIPGFLRGTRWIARSGSPRYLIVYEVANLEVATSAPYLARLNAPTPWTASIMGQLRGMVRGFCRVAGSAGYGLGNVAMAARFSPLEGREAEVRDALAGSLLPAAAARRGMASVHLFEPAARPPMTREQALRGADAPMPWVLMATAWDPGALERASELDLGSLERKGFAGAAQTGVYALHFTVTAGEVQRSPANPPRGKPTY